MPPKVAPKPTPKGKGIAGIPTWGWILGAVIGIVIGYTLVKSSPGSASTQASDGTGGANATPSDNSNAPAPAIPWDAILQAMGLRGGGGGTVPGTSTPNSTSTTNANSAATAPSISDPVITAAAPSPQPVDVGQASASASSSQQPDVGQAFAASVLGVTPQANQTLDQINAQLVASGGNPMAYPSTITANQPGMIDSSMTGGAIPAPVGSSSSGISMIAAHAVLGRDPTP